MSDVFFGLVATRGVEVILLATYLSCLAVPVPSSVVMLAGGAFVASGDLVGWQVLAAAFGGAVLGDQTGYHLGRLGGPALMARINRAPQRARAMQRARAFLARWGGVGVFFSTWAMSPLGPYVNVAAGALGMARARFTVSDTLGEAVWVGLYVGLGYVFANRISQLADLAASTVGFVTAGAVAVGLGLMLRARLRRARAS